MNNKWKLILLILLGPVIKVKRGEKVNLHVTNELSDSTSVHWHGLKVNGTEHGGPHQVIERGALWEPSFIINQQASTLWFHPPVIGTTASQVYYGLAGLLIIEDEFSESLNIPKDYGINDIPLIIQDRSFNNDGSFNYTTNMMDGVIGDTILVNGAITPTLHVNQINIRFRIVNGANASNFKLELSDQTDFYQVASDGGFLDKPYAENSLFISPGERAEIIIDFSKYTEGEVIKIQSGNALIMTFIVGAKIDDQTEIPDSLVEITSIDENKAKSIKTIELDGMGHMVSLNGRKFDMNRINETVNNIDAIANFSFLESLNSFLMIKLIQETIMPIGIKYETYDGLSLKCAIPPLIMPIPIAKVNDTKINLMRSIRFNCFFSRITSLIKDPVEKRINPMTRIVPYLIALNGMSTMPLETIPIPKK